MGYGGNTDKLKVLREWISGTNKIYEGAQALGYKGPKFYREITAFLRKEEEDQKKVNDTKIKVKRTYNYRKKLPEIAEKQRRSRNHWEISFDRNDKFQVYTMNMTFVDRDGNSIPCNDKPSNIISSHKAMAYKALHNWILKNDDILRRWHVRLEADFIFEEVKTGEEYIGGFDQKGENMLLEYNSEFNDFIEKVSNDWREKENKFVSDGYERSYKYTRGIWIIFTPFRDHRKRIKKMHRKNNTEIKSYIRKYNIIITLETGSKINSPQWFTKCQVVNVPSEGINGEDNCCGRNDIVYQQSLSSRPTKQERRQLESKFNWDGFPNGPVTKKYFEHWNKMNPNYYLVIYSFEGLSEETTKRRIP